jgi:GNAT superfamily N-acetyltransferase
MNSNFLIRPIELTDGEAVRSLAAHLGHQRTSVDIRNWLSILHRDRHRHTAFVACAGELLIGWVEVAIEHNLEAAPFALVSNLYLRDDFHHLGIRRLLCAQAEAWAWERGAQTARAYASNRPGTQQFYLHEGYIEVKHLAMLEKHHPR